MYLIEAARSAVKLLLGFDYMSNIKDSLYNLRLLDDLSRKETSIHRIHPLIKLLTTVVYLTVVLSVWKI